MCLCHLEADPTLLCDYCEAAIIQAQEDAAHEEAWAELNWSTQ